MLSCIISLSNSKWTKRSLENIYWLDLDYVYVSYCIIKTTAQTNIISNLRCHPNQLQPVNHNHGFNSNHFIGLLYLQNWFANTRRRIICWKRLTFIRLAWRFPNNSLWASTTNISARLQFVFGRSGNWRQVRRGEAPCVAGVSMTSCCTLQANMLSSFNALRESRRLTICIYLYYGECAFLLSE